MRAVLRRRTTSRLCSHTVSPYHFRLKFRVWSTHNVFPFIDIPNHSKIPHIYSITDLLILSQSPQSQSTQSLSAEQLEGLADVIPVIYDNISNASFATPLVPPSPTSSLFNSTHPHGGAVGRGMDAVTGAVTAGVATLASMIGISVPSLAKCRMRLLGTVRPTAE